MSKYDITKEEYESFVKAASEWEDARKGVSVGYLPSTSTGAPAIPAWGIAPIISSGVSMSTFRQSIVGKLVDQGYWVKATGSRVTKDGWTSGSDWDYVVFDPDRNLDKELGNSVEWHLGGSGRGEEFNSWKQRDVNLILVDKEDVWKKYVIATNLIKTLNSKTKEERIKVFDSVFGRDSNAKAVEF